MEAHGYLGSDTRGTPALGLGEAWKKMVEVGEPIVGSAGLPPVSVPRDPAKSSELDASDGVPVDSKLPLDIKRAAAEIYRGCRSQGASSCRDWMNLNYTGSRDVPLWLNMWNNASAVDFRLALANNVTTFLTHDNFLDICLRRISAYVYEKRTGDRTGAAHILAIRPPGSACGAAPSWLVQEATSHSRQEYKRSPQVTQTSTLSTAAPAPGAYGGGRGRGNDGGAGDGGARGCRGKRGRGRHGRS